MTNKKRGLNSLISDSEVFDYLSLKYGIKPTPYNSVGVKLYSDE